MGLADLFIQAIQNPDQRAATDDVGAIQDRLRTMTGSAGAPQGLDQRLLSTVGSYVRGALRDQRRERGDAAVHETVDRYGGLDRDDRAVEAVFGQQDQERVVRSVSQETGLQPQQVQGMLPALIPMALKLLQGGGLKAPRGPVGASNPLLGSFLDADRDGDVDLGDALGVASRFLTTR